MPAKTQTKGILFITPFFRPSIGGAETLLSDLTDYLRTHGYFIHVVTYQPITGPQRGLSVEYTINMEIHRFQWFGERLFMFFTKLPAVCNFLYLFPYLCLRSFIYMTKRHDEIDIIDSHGLVASGINMVLSKIFHKKCIMTIVAMYDFKSASLFSKITSFILSHADSIIVESPQSKNELEKIGVSSTLIHVFTEWIDLDLFKPQNKEKAKQNLNLPGNFLVLFVGRAIAAKGIDILLDAIPFFHKNIRVMIISTSGPLVDLIRNTAKVNPQIIFKNGCNYSDLPSYYAAADIFIAPSRSEDAPRTIVEALACGTPAIGTRVGGIPSVLSNKIGLLVNLDAKDIAKAVNRLYNQHQIYNNMKDNCRPYALENFSLKNAELFMNIYNSLI